MSRTTLSPECPTKLSSDRIISQQFAQTFAAFIECSDAVQAVVRDMAKVYTSKDATEEEREAALSTIEEALFPKTYGGDLGICLEDWENDAPLHIKAVLKEMDLEEATFGERVNALLETRGMTQSDLAKAIGVGQPAVSMMLTRASRPQRRTVEKIAQALKVSAEEIWPGIKGD